MIYIFRHLSVSCLYIRVVYRLTGKFPFVRPNLEALFTGCSAYGKYDYVGTHAS